MLANVTATFSCSAAERVGKRLDVAQRKFWRNTLRRNFPACVSCFLLFPNRFTVFMWLTVRARVFVSTQPANKFRPVVARVVFRDIAGRWLSLPFLRRDFRVSQRATFRHTTPTVLLPRRSEGLRKLLPNSQEYFTWRKIKSSCPSWAACIVTKGPAALALFASSVSAHRFASSHTCALYLALVSWCDVFRGRYAGELNICAFLNTAQTFNMFWRLSEASRQLVGRFIRASTPCFFPWHEAINYVDLEVFGVVPAKIWKLLTVS